MTHTADHVIKDPQDLLKQLTLIVGQGNILRSDTPEHRQRLQPYLEESRGRQVGMALAVIFPSTTSEVAKIVAACRFHKAPIVPQGGNSGRCLAAQSQNPNAIVINLKNLKTIRELDADNMTITVEAGCILQDIQDHVAAQGYYFPLSLGAEGSCQIGGNLATNAGGINVLRYGNTRELTLGIEAVASNGTVLNDLYGLRKNNTGYDLKHLLIGSEGTLGIITAATLKIFPAEVVSEHGFVAVNHVSDALACLKYLQTRFAGKVSTFEIMPQLAMQLLQQYSDLRCPIGLQHPWYIWYKIAENHDSGTLFDDHVQCLSELMENGLVADATVSQNEAMKQHFAGIREHIVEVQKQHGYSMKFDIAVPISAVPTLIEKGNASILSICPEAQSYPFGHVGDGNIHYNIFLPDNPTTQNTVIPAITTAIYDLVDGLNGSFSAEHGIGSLKINEMQHYKDPVALDLMRRVKQAFDPFNLMNPDKVIPSLIKSNN